MARASKKKPSDGAAASVVTYMIEIPLPHVHTRLRPGLALSVAAAPSGPGCTAIMGRDENENRQKTESCYIQGLANLRGRPQVQTFRVPQEVAAPWPPPFMKVSTHEELRDAFRAEAVLDADRFGPFHVTVGVNFGGGKRRTDAKSWVHRWWHWGGRVVELKGALGTCHG